MHDKHEEESAQMSLILTSDDKCVVECDLCAVVSQVSAVCVFSVSQRSVLTRGGVTLHAGGGEDGGVRRGECPSEGKAAKKSSSLCNSSSFS